MSNVTAHPFCHPKVQIDRIPVDSSRLLDAVARTAEERERRAVISYTQAMEGDEKESILLLIQPTANSI